jgi:hypothetical protein
VLMRRCRHGGRLRGDDQRSAREGDEDLAHDYVPDARVCLAELDHEPDAENRKWDPEV